MRLDLVIAGSRIRLHSSEGISLRPDERFTAFRVPDMWLNGLISASLPDISADAEPGLLQAGLPLTPADPEPDLYVEVEPGPGEIPASAVKVFDARLMEEVPGGVRNTGEPFWEIYSGEEVTYARVFLQDIARIAVLVMPHGANRWKIFAGGDAGLHFPAGQRESSPGSDTSSVGSAGASRPLSAPPERDMHRQNQEQPDDSTVTVNPLPYPLDGLLFYFLFSQRGDIMIHGSGVVSGGRGWIFTGRSGSGKTTMARIFDGAGDRVIHDDRLVLHREGSGWVMHNTPVYRNDEPRSALLDHLWIIRHGAANVSEPVSGAEAVAMILANCIQQNWDRTAAARLAAAADDLAASVTVSRLSFLPDLRVRDYLLLRAEAEKVLAAGAVLSMLDEGRSVTVTAGGYSMWPVIRPGDAVIIGPCGDTVAAAGQIVVLRRDGGFVMHRVIRVMTVSGRRLIVTCGDAAARADEPAGPESVAGIVKSVIRSGRQFSPPRRRWPRWINRLTAVVAGGMRR